MAQALLPEPAFVCAQVNPLNLVAGRVDVWHPWHIFQQEPGGLSQFHAADELPKQLYTLAARSAAPEPAEILAGATAYDPVEAPGRGREVAHIAAEQWIWPANDAEPLGLKSHPEHINPWK